ncbi:MAG: glycosyltransferase family 4 protein [Planctomycetota bacterium]
MNILHVVSSHIDSGPGAAALRMMTALRSAGVESTLACIPGKTLEEHARAQNFRVIDDLTFVRDAKLWQLPGARRKFHACVKDNKFDLVHLHQSPEMILAQLALANEPVAAVRHWHDAQVGLGAEPLRIFLQKPKRFVLGASNATTLLLRKKLAKHALQIDWQPAAVDCAAFSPDLRTGETTQASYGAIRLANGLDTAPASGVLIGIPGRIAERRGVFTALEALLQLGTRIPWSAMFFGQGEAAEVLREKIATAGKSASIHVFSQVHDWPVRMAACDVVLVLRPGSDGSARAVIEAFASGCACVVGFDGGLQDFATGIPGRWPEEARAMPATPGGPSGSGIRAGIGGPGGSGIVAAPRTGLTQMLTRSGGPAGGSGGGGGGGTAGPGSLPGASGTRLIPKPDGSGLRPAQDPGTRLISNPATGAPERSTASLGALAVDPDKPADIAYALAMLIDDIRRRADMREAGRATALRRYEMTAVGKRLKEIYRKLIGF